MSWSFSAIGKPGNVAAALDAFSDECTGQSRIEFDDAKPHLIALVKQNFKEGPTDEQPTVKIQASGSGYVSRSGEQVDRECKVVIEACWTRLVGLLLAFLLIATAASAQTLNFPQDAGKYHVSVCIHDGQLAAGEANLVRSFDEHPVLRQIKSQVFFHVYTASDPMYQAHLAPALPGGVPAVIVQRNRDYTGPLYAASAGSTVAPLPANADALAEKLVAAFGAERAKVGAEQSPGQYAWRLDSNGEAVPGGPYYCDECRRKHAPPPRPSPIPLPGPIQNLVPNIETDAGPLPLLMELPSMHPILTACCVALVGIFACMLVTLVVGACVTLWLHHRKKQARKELLEGAAVLGVGILLYNGDQHKRAKHEMLHKLLEVGAAVAGVTWLHKAMAQKAAADPTLPPPAAIASPKS